MSEDLSKQQELALHLALHDAEQALAHVRQEKLMLEYKNKKLEDEADRAKARAAEMERPCAKLMSGLKFSFSYLHGEILKVCIALGVYWGFAVLFFGPVCSMSQEMTPLDSIYFATGDEIHFLQY